MYNYLQQLQKLISNTAIKEVVSTIIKTLHQPSYRRELRIAQRISEVPKGYWSTQFHKPHGFDTAYFKECLLINRFQERRTSPVNGSNLNRLALQMNKAFDKLDQAFDRGNTKEVQAARFELVQVIDEIFIQFGDEINDAELPQGPTSKAMRSLNTEFSKKASGHNTYQHYAVTKGGMLENGWTAWLEADSARWVYATAPNLADFLCGTSDETHQDVLPLKTTHPLKQLNREQLTHFHQALAARGGSKLDIDATRTGASRVKVSATMGDQMPEMQAAYDAELIPAGQKELGMPANQAGDPILYITKPNGDLAVKVIQRQDEFEKSLRIIQGAIQDYDETSLVVSGTVNDEGKERCTTQTFLKAIIKFELNPEKIDKKELDKQKLEFLQKHFEFGKKYYQPRYTKIIRQVFGQIKDKGASQLSQPILEALETVVAFPGGMREGQDSIDTLAHEISEELSIDLQQVKDALSTAKLVPVYIGINPKDPRNSQESCMFTRAYKLDLNSCTALHDLLNTSQGGDDAFSALWTTIHTADDLKMFSSHGQIMMHLYADLVDQAGRKLHGLDDYATGESETVVREQQEHWLKILNEFCTKELGELDSGQPRFTAPTKEALEASRPALSQQPVDIDIQEADVSEIIQEASRGDQNYSRYKLTQNLALAQDLVHLQQFDQAQTLMHALYAFATKQNSSFYGGQQNRRDIVSSITKQFHAVCQQYHSGVPEDNTTKHLEKAMATPEDAIRVLSVRHQLATAGETIIALSPAMIKVIQHHLQTGLKLSVKTPPSPKESDSRQQVAQLIHCLQADDLATTLHPVLAAACKRPKADIPTLVSFALTCCNTEEKQKALFTTMTSTDFISGITSRKSFISKMLIAMVQFDGYFNKSWDESLYKLCTTLRDPVYKQQQLNLLRAIEDTIASQGESRTLRRLSLAIQYDCAPVHLTPRKAKAELETDIDEIDRLNKLEALHEAYTQSPALQTLNQEEKDAIFESITPKGYAPIRPQTTITLLSRYAQNKAIADALLNLLHDFFDVTQLEVNYTAGHVTYTLVAEPVRSSLHHTDTQFGIKIYHTTQVMSEPISKPLSQKAPLNESTAIGEIQQGRFGYWDTLVDQLSTTPVHKLEDFDGFDAQLFKIKGGTCGLSRESVVLHNTTKRIIKAHVEALIPATQEAKKSLAKILEFSDESPAKQKIRDYFVKCLETKMKAALTQVVKHPDQTESDLFHLFDSFSEVKAAQSSERENIPPSLIKLFVKPYASLLKRLALQKSVQPSEGLKLRALAATVTTLPAGNPAVIALRACLMEHCKNEVNTLPNIVTATYRAQDQTTAKAARDLILALITKSNYSQAEEFLQELKSIEGNSNLVKILRLQAYCLQSEDSPDGRLDEGSIEKAKSINLHRDFNRGSFSKLEQLVEVLHGSQPVRIKKPFRLNQLPKPMQRMIAVYIRAHQGYFKSQAVAFYPSDLPGDTPLSVKELQDMGLRPVIITQNAQPSLSERQYLETTVPSMTACQFRDPTLCNRHIRFHDLQVLAKSHNPATPFAFKLGLYPTERPLLEAGCSYKEGQDMEPIQFIEYLDQKKYLQVLPTHQERFLREELTPAIHRLLLTNPTGESFITALAKHIGSVSKEFRQLATEKANSLISQLDPDRILTTRSGTVLPITIQQKDSDRINANLQCLSPLGNFGKQPRFAGLGFGILPVRGGNALFLGKLCAQQTAISVNSLATSHTPRDLTEERNRRETICGAGRRGEVDLVIAMSSEDHLKDYIRRQKEAGTLLPAQEAYLTAIKFDRQGRASISTEARHALLTSRILISSEGPVTSQSYAEILIAKLKQQKVSKAEIKEALAAINLTIEVSPSLVSPTGVGPSDGLVKAIDEAKEVLKRPFTKRELLTHLSKLLISNGTLTTKEVAIIGKVFSDFSGAESDLDAIIYLQGLSSDKKPNPPIAYHLKSSLSVTPCRRDILKACDTKSKPWNIAEGQLNERQLATVKALLNQILPDELNQ